MAAISYQAEVLMPFLMYGLGLFLVFCFGVSLLWILGWFVFELLPFVARQVLPPHVVSSRAWRLIGSALIVFGIPLGVTVAPNVMIGLGFTGAVVIIGVLIHVGLMRLRGKKEDTY